DPICVARLGERAVEQPIELGAELVEGGAGRREACLGEQRAEPRERHGTYVRRGAELLHAVQRLRLRGLRGRDHVHHPPAAAGPAPASSISRRSASSSWIPGAVEKGTACFVN